MTLCRSAYRTARPPAEAPSSAPVHLLGHAPSRQSRRAWQRPLAACLAALLSVSAVMPLHAQGAAPPSVRLPALGEAASDDFNLHQEKRIGEQIMREIRRDPDYLDDALLLDYLQSLWRPLVQAARARGDIGADTERLFPYELFLVRDRSVNAFALPGGFVGVHLGLAALTATPDELASVLAHELSHITRRHIARSVAAASQSSTLGLVGMLLGLVVASRANSADAAQAAVMGGQAAIAQSQLNFSRDMEREADRTGLALMGEAGFAPAGMAGMFDKLDQSARLNDSGGFPYLRSHPLTVERVGEARQMVQSASGAARAPPQASAAAALGHGLMQARARVMMDPSAQALRRLQDFDTRGAMPGLSPADRLVGLYAGGLASSQLRDFDRAARDHADALALLDTLGPAADGTARQAVAHLGIRLALQRGQASRANAALDSLAAAPRANVLLRAEVALTEGRPAALQPSAEALQTWVSEHRDDATAWLLLSQTSHQLGQRLRALRADAESQAALGNLPGAIDRLRAGQQVARSQGTADAAGRIDFIEASVIDARLRDLLAQRRELTADQRRGNQRSPPPE